MRTPLRSAVPTGPTAASGTIPGPRAAIQPASSSAGTTVPGMNQVQSISECTPKTTTTATSVSRPGALGARDAADRTGATGPSLR